MSALWTRALHRAVRVPGAPAPHDTLHARVHYPASPPSDDDAVAAATGTLTPDRSNAPLPLVVVLGGINVGPESYRWVAEALCPHGYAVVTYSYVAETAPGDVGLTPGIDIGLVRPETYGTAPSASALAPLLDDLAHLHGGDGPLGGLLDLDRVGLIGHSAGGTAVLLNLEPGSVPGLSAAVTYGAHSGVATMLGWPAGTVLPVTGDVPLLLLEGDRDGVIAASASRYRSEATRDVEPDAVGRSAPGSADDENDREAMDHDPVGRTFQERRPGVAECRHVVVRGATHFTFCHPEDPTTGRGFLEGDAGDRDVLRAWIGSLVRTFLDAHLRDLPDPELDTLVRSSTSPVAFAQVARPTGSEGSLEQELEDA